MTGPRIIQCQLQAGVAGSLALFADVQVGLCSIRSRPVAPYVRWNHGLRGEGT